MRLIDADELLGMLSNGYETKRALDLLPTVDLWRYPSKGEYPTEGETVFVAFQETGLWYFANAEYHEGGWASVVDLGNIVAWQYIIPPEIKDLKCHAKVTIKAADNNNIEGERRNDKL